MRSSIFKGIGHDTLLSFIWKGMEAFPGIERTGGTQAYYSIILPSLSHYTLHLMLLVNLLGERNQIESAS